MQIVIDIDDELYKQIKKDSKVYVLDDVNIILIENAIYHGTPLPKGHGRIMDVDKIIKKMEEREERLKDDESIWETASVETAIDMFGETIIEADKESEDKE